jgi:ABC-type transporter Mla maintaining outer membrane lipid asymmetry ATPase subunit MlaF
MRIQMPKTTADASILVKGLRKSFGKQTVLDGISLAVRAGETVAVT